MADVGLETTDAVIESLKEKVKENRIKEPSECKELLAESLTEQMLTDEHAYDFEEKKSVVILIGVNGVGKTTTAGKLASIYRDQGKKVILAAADTFRAAAIEQLTEWAHRSDVPIIAQKEGSDPAAVVFDAIGAAKARNADVLICDTAGRLHNKKNLMNELEKIFRVIGREYPEAAVETLVVVDAATGQNAKEQAKQFSEVTKVDGIVLTKLDGSAKGGIAIAIQKELGIPVKYIGVGEQIADLQRFDARSFVNALLDINEDNDEDGEAAEIDEASSSSEITDIPESDNEPESLDSEELPTDNEENTDEVPASYNEEDEVLFKDTEPSRETEETGEPVKKHWWNRFSRKKD